MLAVLLTAVPSLAEEPKCEDYTDVEEIYILIDKTHTISPGPTATQLTHEVWKLCKKQEDCSYVFYFNRDHQTFEITKCRVKHDGDWIECPRERMREYADAIVVPFPSCEKDDVLEYEAVWETTFPMKDAFWSTDDLFFNSTSPISDVSLTVKVPKDFEFKYYTTQLSPDVSEDGDYNVYKWQVKDLDPYEPEYYTPPARVILSRVSYSSIGSWNELEEWFEGLFSDAINKELVSSKVNEIIEGKTTKEEKTKAIYDWVRENIRYEESEFGFLTGYKPHTVDEILEYKFGDCKDQTVLLVSMLKAADIEAYPALLSYRSIIDAPSPQAFWHSVVFVPRDIGDLWLDPTCSECPYGYTNSMIQGGMVLILFDEKKGFVSIPELPVEKNNLMEAEGITNLKEDGSADVYGSVKWVGSDAIYMRYGFKILKESDIEEIFQTAIKEECTRGKLNNYTYSDLEKEDTRFIMTMNFTCEGFASRSGDKLIHDLSGESMYAEVTSKENRTFPINLWPEEMVLTHTEIILPKCFGVEMVPDSFSRNESFTEYELKFDLGEDRLVMDSKVEITGVWVPPGNFSTFKEFFEEVESSQKQAIVFVPIHDRVDEILKTSSDSIANAEGKLNGAIEQGVDVGSMQDILNNAKEDLENAQNLFDEEKCMGAEKFAAGADEVAVEVMKSVELSTKLKELTEAVNDAEKEGADVTALEQEINSLRTLKSDADKEIKNAEYDKANEMIGNITSRSDELIKEAGQKKQEAVERKNNMYVIGGIVAAIIAVCVIVMMMLKKRKSPK